MLWVTLLLAAVCAVLSSCNDDTGSSAQPPAGGNGSAAAGGGGTGGSVAWGGFGGSAGAPQGGSGGVGGSSEPTTCTLVAHIGDSLTYYTEDDLTAAYLLVGITAQIDAYGGRAIFQKLPDDPRTGEQAAIAIREDGFDGCWVVALGTNDTANVAAGAWYTRGEAIDAMMTAIDPGATARVLWVNTYTELDTGYWSNDNMILWNQALVEAQTRWSNLRIFDWAAIAATDQAPFVDGIHHTTAGYAVRNAAIAQAVIDLL